MSDIRRCMEVTKLRLQNANERPPTVHTRRRSYKFFVFIVNSVFLSLFVGVFGLVFLVIWISV